MANKNIPDIFNEVASAIQKKTFKTKALDPVNFATEIENIPQTVTIADLDEAFDEAVGTGNIWENGYFLGYYDKTTKNVDIQLEPLNKLGETNTWAANADDHIVYMINSSNTAEINYYTIASSGFPEINDNYTPSPSAGLPKVAISKLYTTYNGETYDLEGGVYGSLEVGLLYSPSFKEVESGSTTYEWDMVPLNGTYYQSSSSGAIYTELVNNKVYMIPNGSDPYIAYSSIPAEDTLLRAVKSSDKIVFADYSLDLLPQNIYKYIGGNNFSSAYSAGTYFYMNGTGGMWPQNLENAGSGIYYYSDSNSELTRKYLNASSPYTYMGNGDFESLSIPEGLTYISWDSGYSALYNFESVDLNSGTCYTYEGDGNFSELDGIAGLQYVTGDCGVWNFSPVDLYSEYAYIYHGNNDFTAISDGLYYIENWCDGVESVNVDWFKAYTYGGYGNFTELNADTFYYYNQPYYSETNYAQALSIEIDKLYLCTYVDPQHSVVSNERTLVNIELPQSSGASVDIVINGEHYTLTKD